MKKETEERWLPINEGENNLQFVYEMANKYKEETLLPVNIWIDETGSYISGGHSKRIKFQLDKSCRFHIGNCGEMDLDGNIYPKGLNTLPLKEREKKQLRNFVYNNRYALEHIADQDVKIHQIWGYIIKGGKRASEDAIKALNAKVDEFIIINKEEEAKEMSEDNH